MTEQNPTATGERDATPTPSNGWTVVHSKRAQVPNGRYEGVWLGTCDGEWVAGRMHSGKSMTDGFTDGEWWYSHYFEFGENSTVNMDEALQGYVKLAEVAAVWDRMFDQDAGEAIDRYLAGPEVPGAAKLSAHWYITDPGHLNQYGAHTEPLPLHDAKYELLHFLRTTELNAMAHLTVGGTVDRHEAIEQVRAATGPIRFEHGYNTYWLASEDKGAITDQAARSLHDAQQAHAEDDTQPSAADLLAQIWCRYLDLAGRPDPDAPSTDADRSARVEPLIEVYEKAYLGSDAPESVIRDVITDLLHFAAHNGLIGDGEGQVPSVESLTDGALTNFLIEHK